MKGLKILGKVVPDGEGGVALPNWLAHHYFWERAGPFMTQDGRAQMIHELDQVRETLDSLDGYFTKITDAWGRRHGVTREMIEQHMNHLVDEA